MPPVNWPEAKTCAMPARFVVPVTPYTRDMPYSMMAEAIAPYRKYFIAPSLALGSFRR